ncbi:AAA family ATPase [Corynebacterium otitidis]|uniref:AAA family ATPase n=1 Tax=Corynebacterium otitidis TaxID=29321 RepID=UPI000627B703|nr:hypothetical protein [Corynebacterium otitidis]KKO83725.1 hypothetical protein AAV33_04890 [Corynebacterium otitidis]
MKIHRLVIENLRGVRRATLAGLPDTGVIVVSGDNELGKSTVPRALDLVLGTKHSSSAKALKADIRSGSPSARVELEATLAGTRFVVDKTYGQGSSARLKLLSPQPEELTGRQAEDRLERLVRAGLDRSLSDALVLNQGQLGQVIAPGGASGSVEEALSRAGAGSAPADAGLVDAAHREALRYYTRASTRPGENPKPGKGGLLAGPIAERDRARDAHAEAQEAERSVARDAAEIARVEKNLAEAAEAIPGLEEEEKAAAEAARRAGTLTEKAEAARKDAGASRDRARDAARRLAEREAAHRKAADLEKSIQHHEAERDAAGRDETSIGERREVLETSRGETRAKREELTRRRAELKDEADALEARERARQAASRLAELRGLAEKVAAAERRADKARSLEVTTPTGVEVADEDVDRLRRLAGAAENAAARAEAATGRLELEADGTVTVVVDGEELDITPEGATVPLEDGTVLEVGGLRARVSLGSGQDDGSGLRDAARRAEQKLTDELERLGAGGVEEAAGFARRAKERDDEVASAAAERRTLLTGAGLRDAAALEGRLRALEEQATGPGGDDTEDVEGRGLDEVHAEIREADAEVRNLDEELRSLEGQLDDVRTRAGAARERLATAKANLDSARERLKETKENLEAAEQEEPIDELRERAAGLKGEAERAEAAARDAADEAAAARPEEATGAARQAAAKLDQARSEQQSLGEQVSALRGRLSARRGAGVELSERAADLERAEEELAAVERRAHAALTLYRTLVDHRERVRASHERPYQEILDRLGEEVFGPGTCFTLGPSLEIQQRVTSGVGVPVGALSGGAKEQVDIISRLALAALVSREETGSAPVIIDDALGSSDRSRVERVCQVLSRFADTGQIFVLTCWPERYAQVSDDARHDVSFEDALEA